MTPLEIKMFLLNIEILIINERWSYAIEYLAKLAVYCTENWRKTNFKSDE